jgi:hypothetical protein
LTHNIRRQFFSNLVVLHQTSAGYDVVFFSVNVPLGTPIPLGQHNSVGRPEVDVVSKDGGIRGPEQQEEEGREARREDAGQDQPLLGLLADDLGLNVE